MKAIFFEVKKNTDKLLKIIEYANYHFDIKKRLFFLVDDDKAENFLDDLLWTQPNFSFLPHTTDISSEKDLIIITKTNIKNPSFIFNLTAKPIENFINTVYEFEDFTSKEKEKISKNKFKYYKGKNLIIQNA